MEEFKSIQNVLKNLIKDYGLENSVSNELIHLNWNQIVGEQLAKQCKPVKIENNILFLKTRNSIWRNELNLKQEELLKLIRESLKKDTIRKIIFV